MGSRLGILASEYWTLSGLIIARSGIVPLGSRMRVAEAYLP